MDTIDTLITIMALFQYSQGCYADITSYEFISLPEEEQDFNKICYERANELIQYYSSLLPEKEREEILNTVKNYDSKTTPEEFNRTSENQHTDSESGIKEDTR